MNFNSYDFDFEGTTGGPTLVQYDEAKDKIIGAELKADVCDAQTTVDSTLKDAGCIGQECCATGTMYNKKTNKCIPHTSS